MRTTRTEAILYLSHARDVCQALNMHEALRWVRVAMDSVWDGTDAERQALALALELRAADIEAIAALKSDAQWRADLEADARAFGFCAAVLRALESGEGP